jgi:FkbM family methyltransferase
MKNLAQMVLGIEFYGQYNQDLYAYCHFKGKKDGFFIDIGANDGVTVNNTLLFEKLGWQGICIEPQPDIFAKLQRNRSCNCYNLGILEKPGEKLDFFKVTGVSGKNEWMNMLSAFGDLSKDTKKQVLGAGGKIERIQVETSTFQEVMGNHPTVHFIDYISIDVEGLEMQILRSIDFEKFSFGILDIERDAFEEDCGQELTSFLEMKGYHFRLRLGGDMIFTRQ